MQKKRRQANKRKKNKNKSFFRKVLHSIIVLGFWGLGIVICLTIYFSRDLPDLENLKTNVRDPAVVIQTYSGEIIGSYGDLYADLTKVKDLPKYVPEAFMAIEDKRFLNHFGVDFIGFFRALYNNYVAHKVVQGGSTITQQLAKNLLISEGVVTHYDRSISRKIKELILAFELEFKFSKSQIMMMYLNRVYFGSGTYGIDAAARKYFNKQAKYLNEFEAAVLAGLLKAPSRYNPTSNPNFAKDRATVVLTLMEEQGFINSAKEILSKESEDSLKSKSKAKDTVMYFCDYVYEQAKKILGEIDEDIVIVSTLDLAKQKLAQKAIKEHFEKEAEEFKIEQMAMVCLGRDGAIEAMVGGTGYSVSQFNRATQALRQPGSAFKLFVYVAALEYGYQLDDLISDEPVEIAGWKPRNYKWQTRGEISVLDGFTHSVNAVSIRLAQVVGIKRIAKLCARLGIDGVSRHDLSVSIGTSEMTLLDLTAAYAAFIDNRLIWPYGIMEIRNKEGKVLFSKEITDGADVVDEEVFSNTRTLLRNVIKRGTGGAANVSDSIFGKTGTNGDTDAWFIGFYDKKEDNDVKPFAIGVWCGVDTARKKMAGNSTGGRVPARIAKTFFQSVLDKKSQPDDGETDIQSEKPRSELDSLLDEAI